MVMPVFCPATTTPIQQYAPGVPPTLRTLYVSAYSVLGHSVIRWCSSMYPFRIPIDLRALGEVEGGGAREGDARAVRRRGRAAVGAVAEVARAGLRVDVPAEARRPVI